MAKTQGILRLYLIPLSNWQLNQLKLRQNFKWKTKTGQFDIQNAHDVKEPRLNKAGLTWGKSCSYPIYFKPEAIESYPSVTSYRVFSCRICWEFPKDGTVSKELISIVGRAVQPSTKLFTVFYSRVKIGGRATRNVWRWYCFWRYLISSFCVW